MLISTRKNFKIEGSLDEVLRVSTETKKHGDKDKKKTHFPVETTYQNNPVPSLSFPPESAPSAQQMNWYHCRKVKSLL